MILRNLVTLVFHSICLFNICKGEYENFPAKFDEEDGIIFQKYVAMDKQLKNIVSYGIKSAIPILVEGSERLNLTARCMGNILLLTTGIRKLRLSAIRFLDASGKPAAGILDGTMHMLGDYDECLKSFMVRRRGDVAFKGQYCLVNFTPYLPKKRRPITLNSGNEEMVEATRNASEVVRYLASKAHLFRYSPGKFGVCVPSGCNENDVSQMVKYVSEMLFVNASLEYCDANTDIVMKERNIVFMCVFVFIGTLIISGTIVECYSKKNILILKSKIVKLLLCFSIITNFPKAISTKRHENSISCLNGIRALTLFYVILLHQYYTNSKFYIASHTILFLDEVPKFFFQIVANGFLTADVFFFVSGLVNCYTRMKKRESRTQNTNFFFICIHRLIRIGPPYLFFLFLMSFILPHGPMKIFRKMNYEIQCEKYWWQNLLFINNFFFQETSCFPHAWFIATDFQLFLLSLFTVPVLFTSPKKGIVVNCAVIICGIVLTVLWSLVNQVTPGVVLYRPNNDELNKTWNAHATTFPHIAPYFTGILMGYVLATKRNIKISKAYQVIGWPVATLLFVSMLFMTKVWNSGGAFTAVDSSFYFSFSKFLFVLGVAWMVLCCASGNGGVINYVLSLPLWIPIARISYLVYLIAPVLQNFYFANSRTIIDFNRMPLIWRYAGDTAISCVFGIALYVLIEAPFPAIENLILYKKPPLNEAVIMPTDILKEQTPGVKKNVDRERQNNPQKDGFYLSKNDF